jgi:hypothetical protein
MNIGRIIKFLVSGIVIGAVLFFAGFGLINMMNKPSEVPAVVENQTSVRVPSVTPPTIEVSSTQGANSVTSVTTSTDSITSNQQGTGNSPIKIKPLTNDDGDVAIEGGESDLEMVQFGTLTLSTVNSINGEATNSNFLIENSQNVAIALVKDTATSTLSLPVGDYKITVSNTNQKIVRFLGVKADKNGAEVFEMDVPVLTGEAPNTDTPSVQTPETTTPSSNNTDATSTTTVAETSETQNEASTDNTAPEVDSNPVVATASNETEAQETRSFGGLRLSALTKQGKRPTVVSFTISRLNGQLLQNIQNVKTQQLTLPAGQYKITAKSANSTTVKQVEVLATKGVHEIFLIPNQPETTQQTSSPQTTQQPAQAASSAVTNSTTAVPVPSAERAPEGKEPGKLELFAQNVNNNSAVKSNFYVQMPNGTMVASKVYVDSIGYKLAAGQYKVIVRATGFKDKSVMLNVRPGQTRREVFKLDSVNQPVDAPRVAPASATPQQPQNTTAAYGGLTVNVVKASDRSALTANIVITQRDGTPLKQAFGVASASFDLPPREFIIRVTYDGFTTNHQVNIVKGKLAIKTISIDTTRMSRQERRRLRRERQERSQ